MTAHWQRADATAMTGSLIRWPTHLESSRDGGTSVYAVWPARQEEPMEVCSKGLVIRANLLESPLGVPEQWHEAFPHLHDGNGERRDQSTDLLGILLLGTTGATWTLRDPAMPSEASGDFWTATDEDLSDSGRAVLESISMSYGRVILLTVLDT